MTVKLSEYDEALLREIGHFCDTLVAEQVRAVMIARNNADARLEAVKAALLEPGQPAVVRAYRARAALSVAPGGVA